MSVKAIPVEKKRGGRSKTYAPNVPGNGWHQACQSARGELWTKKDFNPSVKYCNLAEHRAHSSKRSCKTIASQKPAHIATCVPLTPLRANESSGACNKRFHLLSRLPYLELTPQSGKALKIKLERCKGQHESFHRQLFSLSLQ